MWSKKHIILALVLLSVALITTYRTPTEQRTHVEPNKEENRSASLTESSSKPQEDKLATRHAVLVAPGLPEATESGLYRLNAAELWDVTQKHSDKATRQIACYLNACVTYASFLQAEVDDSVFGGKGRENIFKAYCGRLVRDNPNYFVEEYQQFYFSTEAQCGSASFHGAPLTAKLEEMDLPESEIIDGIAKSSSPDDLLAYTILAIHLERGLTNVNYDVLKGSGSGEPAIRRLAPFVGLLAIKFGCRLPGYCDPGSVALFSLCVAHSNLVCLPGDNLDALAERNLPPVQYEIWRRASLRPPPG